MTEPTANAGAAQNARAGYDTASMSRLASAARQLARQHELAVHPTSRSSPVTHLRELRTFLRATYQGYVEASERDLTISYAAEWLLDNYYMVEQAIREVRQDLPEGYYRQLPKLATPGREGFTRIHDIAVHIIAQCEAHLDIERIRRFTEEYQQVTALQMGELWALPTMLRLGTLENLARAFERILDRDALKSDTLTVPAGGLQPEVVVANSILSLRMLATSGWEAFFEGVSLVDRVLRADPAGAYARMEFDTRDRYRKEVERLARATGREEQAVAQAAIALASEVNGASGGANTTVDTTVEELEEGDGDGRGPARERAAFRPAEVPREAHVGYYLLAEGREALERSIAYQPSLWGSLRSLVRRHPSPFYFGAIALFAVLLIAAAIYYTSWAGGSAGQMAVAGLVVIIPGITLAVELVNQVVTRIVPPKVLPKLDLETGVPDAYRTVVTIPALFASEADIERLVEQLERHYLGNVDPNVLFALLTDLPDADEQHLPHDDALIDVARAQIRRLNAIYGDPEGEECSCRPFYLFHRERRWNPAEERWMGWERKRGKLMEFLGYLRGHGEGSFVVREGDLARLDGVRYVITLDADTLMLRGTALRLIGALAHPLNRATFDDSGRIVSGYSVLQPRLQIEPVSSSASLFARIFSGSSGYDLYSLAVSDVYQDLFGEGVFAGKGILDVEAFWRSLEGRTPENALLSHDLFEGIHGRAALATDITLLEDYPAHYLAHTRRQHRWVRGDWQLLPWLAPRVPAEGGTRRPNDLSFLDRWKIVDNLRRSLIAPSVVLLWVVGWLWLSGSPWVWFAAGALVPLAPALIAAIPEAVAAFLGGTSPASVLRTLRLALDRQLLELIFIPYEAANMVHAIGQTLVRMYITHRGMLEWTPAAHTERSLERSRGPAPIWAEMAPAPIVALTIGALLALENAMALAVAAPFIVLWVASPQIAYAISLPLDRGAHPLSTAQNLELRRLARRTWLFYEDFAGPDDNWLPPDHYQESPRGLVAHRTSPTNIGMLLLSTLSAYDLGYLGLIDLVLRLRYTMETLDRMEHYRGHLLNWYDTQSLAPLPARYVSTVDSGNLVASLMAMIQGCLELRNQPVVSAQQWEGGCDALDVLEEVLEGLREDGLETEHARVLRDRIEWLRDQLLRGQSSPANWAKVLDTVCYDGCRTLSEDIARVIEAESARIDVESLRDLTIWSDRVHHHLISLQSEIELLLPWVSLFRDPPQLFTDPETALELLDAWRELVDSLPSGPVLADVPTVCETASQRLEYLRDLLVREGSIEPKLRQARLWCANLADSLEDAGETARDLLEDLEYVIERASAMVEETDFGFLYDPRREVFHIGFNVDIGELDNSYYDLLASEARTASLVAIAKGDVPQKHWLHMARPLTEVDGRRTLLSWSGTMFEYLMPAILMEHPEDTLLGQSIRAAVEYQIAYGRERGVPWGISESGYYGFDANQAYQYRAFGAPRLGLKRGLAEDLVITPYASLLALPVSPHEALRNVRALRSLGALGRYGFYEAVDFTAAHLSVGQRYAIVRSFMAHHQAMILLPLANCLLGDRIPRRFHADPRVRSVELLLHERIPHDAPLEEVVSQEVPAVRPEVPQVGVEAWQVPTRSLYPEVHVLSNGDFTTFITSSGAGYSRWQDLDLTRWRADTALENTGNWLYVYDQDNEVVWSGGLQPVAAPVESESVLYYAHQAEFHRRRDGLSVRTRIGVSLEDDVEIRQVVVNNHTDRVRHVNLTSYAEVALAPHGGDLRHPAFSKLFVESEYLPDRNALLFRRRPRSSNERPIYLLHMVVCSDDQPGETRYETDRMRFLGRGHTAREPQALGPGGTGLSGTTGATLDPIMALSQDIVLEPYTATMLSFITIAARSRQQAIELSQRYRDAATIARAFDLARSRIELELRQLDVSARQIRNAQRLLSALICPCTPLRAEHETLAANTLGQSSLWGRGISGDYPILLVRVRSVDDLALVQELLPAHVLWRRRNLRIDLVILNEQPAGYSQELEERLHRMLERTTSGAWMNRRGGIFLVDAERLESADRILLETAARVVLDGGGGPLAEQLEPLDREPVRLPELVPTRPMWVPLEGTPPVERPTDLLFDNGIGGFTPDGREYVIYLRSGEWTPVPWSNVVANPELGFIATESGSAYTWAVNSGENRLTPWSNDVVSDPPGEAIYLRDEETGQIWSPTPLPARADAPYLVRHGAGYTVYEHNSHRLKQQLTLSVAPEDPVKLYHLRLENTSDAKRRITATLFASWVLGTNAEESRPFVIPEFDGETQALLGRNPYNAEFGERVAFAASSNPLHGMTGDRVEFLGRLGELRHPAALDRVGLDRRFLPGFDPCAALKVHIDLDAGETQDVWFLLGQGRDREHALDLVRHYRRPEAARAALDDTVAFWEDLLGRVTVETPDRAMDVMLNRWLLYQGLSARIWGRSGFYQSSGAYGFRDQLQDVMALVHVRPEEARQHILRAAAHQFERGDVLHWWHPPSGRGVRTRITDDLLWLPYVTAHYVATTGDATILNEEVPYLTGPILDPDEEERYDHYRRTDRVGTLFEHCVRAIEHGFTEGRHGLPLMGAGDWNDGMNRVGIEGQGESVWLGWFIHVVLTRFAALCRHVGQGELAEEYERRAERLQQALNAHAWDGGWYLRAFYDDGSPLGSSQNLECQIDSIAQSWSVLSGAGTPERQVQAMAAVNEHLVRRDDQLIMLFTPPFDRTTRDPGYIKGYLPGIRENGGQYTHGAVWTVWAFAKLGQGNMAGRLYALLNPINHAKDRAAVERYHVEPYVVAADVYSVPPHNGRGGWTWYTGSAGWMYRLGLEAILGMHREGDALRIDPRIPEDWPSFRVTYRFGAATYHIEVDNPYGVQQGVLRVTLDGEAVSEERIPLMDDGGDHHVRVTMG